MKYTQDAFGSRLEIILSHDSNDSGISESFSIVEDFEKKYSRFKQGNVLTKINNKKQAVLDPEISSLLHLCLKVSKLTQGSFDITLLPVLENLGYGIATHKTQENIGYQHIHLDGNQLTLSNDISIEFWSFWKWYMLDLVHAILWRYHSEYMISFWGDIRIKGKQKILLEDPLDIKKQIWEIVLENLSIASSAGNRRNFGNAHHLINAKNKVSQDEVLAVYVTHKLGVFADIFATALFVTPLKLSLDVLEQIDGLEALIIWSDGKIYKSEGFKAKLYI